MKFLLQGSVFLNVERREQVFEMDESIRWNLGSVGDSKALLRDCKSSWCEQVALILNDGTSVRICGKRHASKAQGSIKVKTVFGQVEVPNPRWHLCLCQSIGQDVRPMKVGSPDKPVQRLLLFGTKWLADSLAKVSSS